MPDACKNGGMEVSLEYTWGNSYAEFKADNTYEALMDGDTQEMAVIFSDECLIAMTGGQQGAKAEDICNAMSEDGSCTYSSGKCNCVQKNTEEPNTTPDTGTYVANADGSITFDEKAQIGEYCVAGSKLSLKYIQTDAETGEKINVIYIFKK